MAKNSATISFKGSLQDFAGKQQVRISFFLNPSAKDLIESTGVPHIEIYGLLINGQPTSFSYNVSDGDDIVVIPKELAGRSYTSNIRRGDIHPTTFIADVHLGKIARLLRLIGFDTVYSNCADDRDIVEQSIREGRAVLTRDIGLLKHGDLQYGYWLRSTIPENQLVEVVDYFKLRESLDPFSRCMECNGVLKAADKQSVIDRLPPKVVSSFSEFYQCAGCAKVYWKGTHYKELLKKVNLVQKKG